MAQQLENGQSDTKEKKKKRKSLNESDQQQPQQQQSSSPTAKKTRRQLVAESILEKYHQSQKLQGILKKQQRQQQNQSDDLDELEGSEATENEPEQPTVQLSAQEQQEADQVLDDVNKLRKEKKKQLAKEKKKFKAQQRLLQKQQAEEEAKQTKQDRALAYLKQWKKHRDEWKFKKLDHIWLLKNWKHSSKVPDKRFKTFLKYIKSTEQKSLALQRLEQEAKAIVDRADAEAANAEDEETNHSYARARSVLQWIV